MKHKWIKFFLFGGLGGISPTLLKFAFHPLTYFSEFMSAIHWFCWVVAVIIFFIIGGIVAYLAEKKSFAKAFYLGISAPSIIFAVYHASGTGEYQVKHEYKKLQANIYASCLALVDLDSVTYEQQFEKKEDKWVTEAIEVESGKPIEIIVGDTTAAKAIETETIEIETEPGEQIEIIIPPTTLIRYLPLGPIYLNIALATHSMGSHTVPISIFLQNDSTITTETTVDLYREKHKKTIIDSYVEICLRKVDPGDYNFIIEIALTDTLLTDSEKISFTELDQVRVVCIVDMIEKKIYLHHAKNLGGTELRSWIEELQKQHGKQPGLLHRIIKGIFDVFF